MMDIDQLYHNGLISKIDRHFAQLLARYATHNHTTVQTAAALVSRAAAHGNVCLDLEQEITFPQMGAEGRSAVALRIDPRDWATALEGSRVVGRPGEYKPLILDGTRLYLQRHWQYEQDVATGIRQRCRSIIDNNTSGQIAKKLVDLFPEGDDQQRRAVLCALTQGFTVISGGPGTGKTYTIAKLILLMQQLDQGTGMRIQLAAPTGKAAMRLQQAIENVMATMGQSQDALEIMGGGIQTLHRLLGANSGKSGFRYHRNNKLSVDAVIVDEASMIDLSMMAALIAALPDEARLVLIGDKNQLASVEAGAVLGDICSGADTQNSAQQLVSVDDDPGSLSRRIVVLQHSYRFATHGNIDALAVAVNAGETSTVQALLNKPRRIDVVFKKMQDAKALEQALEKLVVNAIVPNFKAQDPLIALKRMERLMVLSPLRNGPYGVRRLNTYIEQTLAQKGLISLSPSVVGGWYAGRPVMVTRNNYYHNLFNGDVGIAMPKENGEKPGLAVFFQDGSGGCKQLSYRQLPPHETAYAMTVHKSQGSEFDRVILVLPDRESPVVTRELVYTAITRARHSVEIWGSEQRLHHAIQQRTQRSSGLMPLLWPSI